LPRAGFYLVQGDPGSGKTTLALQFLLGGLRRGEKVFYITLSETKQELFKVARSHGWSLDKIPVLDLSAVENLLRPEAQTTVFHPSEVELTKVSQLLLDNVRKVRPARVAFDSLSEFRLMAETALRYRRQLLTLKQQFAEFKSTVLLLDDKMNKAGVIDPHVLSLTHGVIDMEQLSPDYGTSRRRLRVSKLRAVKFREGYRPRSKGWDRDLGIIMAIKAFRTERTLGSKRCVSEAWISRRVCNPPPRHAKYERRIHREKVQRGQPAVP
jgi:circadian clock protein KaiC